MGASLWQRTVCHPPSAAQSVPCECPLQISPTTLFFIEGTGQSWSGAMCWGDGFITDRQKIDSTGTSDPNPFFLQLITKPYVYNVVIAPHYYPPSISHSTACYTGTCLYE